MSLSGFGMGGTNAHFVLEEGRGGLRASNQADVDLTTLSSKYRVPKRRLSVLSTHDQASFQRQRNALVTHLDDHRKSVKR